MCSYIPDLLEVIQVSSEEVVSLLSQLDTSKATGPDKLPAIILKTVQNHYLRLCLPLLISP